MLSAGEEWAVWVGEQLKPAGGSRRHAERWAVMALSDDEVGVRVRKKDRGYSG